MDTLLAHPTTIDQSDVELSEALQNSEVIEAVLIGGGDLMGAYY